MSITKKHANSKYHTITPEDEIRCCGMSLKDIAAEFGGAMDTACRYRQEWRKKHNLEVPKKTKKIKKENGILIQVGKEQKDFRLPRREFDFWQFPNRLWYAAMCRDQEIDE